MRKRRVKEDNEISKEKVKVDNFVDVLNDEVSKRVALFASPTIQLFESTPFTQKKQDPTTILIIPQEVLKQGQESLKPALSDKVPIKVPKQKKTLPGIEGICYDSYSFCSEIKEDTILDVDWIKCLQKTIKEQKLSVNPVQYYGKRYKEFLWFIQKKNSYQKPISVVLTETDLVKDDSTRGTETIWFYLSPLTNETIVLYSEVKFVKDMTEFSSIFPTEVAENIAFTTAFEIRPEITNPLTLTYDYKGNGGIAIGYNQNPFETTSFAQYDRGDLITDSSVFPYEIKSPEIILEANKKNTIVIKWRKFRKQNKFLLDFKLNGIVQDSTTQGGCKHFYLTQEPFAPWLQYEVCTKRNRGTLETNLLEKRWNQPMGFSGVLSGSVYPSFDISTNGVSVENDSSSSSSSSPSPPWGAKVKLLGTNSKWQTLSRFSYTSFKTLSIVLRPYSDPFSEVRVFSHGPHCVLNLYKMNETTYVFRFWNGRTWEQKECFINSWNFIVFQYILTKNSLEYIHCHIYNYEELIKNKSERSKLIKEIKGVREIQTISLIEQIDSTNPYNSGYLILGSDANTLGVRGDVKWIHGFRYCLDKEDELIKELKNQWLRRWD
jgi:hypothetical protein